MSLLDFQDTTHRPIHAFAPPVSTCHRLSFRGCCALLFLFDDLLCYAQLGCTQATPLPAPAPMIIQKLVLILCKRSRFVNFTYSPDFE